MIDFESATLLGNGDQQRFFAVIIGSYLSGHYQYGPFEHPSFDQAHRPLLRALAELNEDVTKDEVESDSENLGRLLYDETSDPELGMYHILPGVELQFVKKYNSVGNPGGFTVHKGLEFF